MRALQLAVFSAVMGANIHYQWTDNVYLAVGWGAAAALIVSHWTLKAAAWWRGRR